MSDIKVYTITEPYIKSDNTLGEGPFYEEKTNSVRWVDIVKDKIYTVNLDEGPSSFKELVSLPFSVGTTADIEGNEDEFIFGGKSGYGIFNRKTGQHRDVKKIWSEEELADGYAHRMRSNDGAIDSKGRYWVGYMVDQKVESFKPLGAVWRLDNDLSLHRMIEKVTIPNGITWTDDDKTMFWTESVDASIYAYDYDAESGSISNKRVFWKSDVDGQVPDGHVLDEEGYIWTAVHGMGGVLRISPEGKVVAKIEIPTRSTTCPVFIGEDLFITSAEDEDERYPESQKNQGHVWRIHVGVKGQKLHKFKFAPGVTA